MATFQFELPWPPSGNVQTRHTKSGGHYLNPAVAAYRVAVRRSLVQMGLGSNPPLIGPLSVAMIGCPVNRRATDADNRIKCALDALVHAGMLADDSNRVVRKLSWEWCDPEPGGRLHVSIMQYGGA